MDYLKLTLEKLHVEEICELVASPTCGAISTFIGTTRDHFESKQVLQLEYEAYESMALKAMASICSDVRQKWPEVENIAIYHRLGIVPVKEASIVIATSSPHRSDALKATEFCIDNVKQYVPIWKKEVYAKDAPQWKENVESLLPAPALPAFVQTIEAPNISAHLIQIKASSAIINERIESFMERKRAELNKANVRDFCRRDCDTDADFSCARVDSALKKRKDSKGHLQVNTVYNTCSHRDQDECHYLRQHIPQNGIEERLANLETQLSLDKAVPKNIYVRLKLVEDRLLHLEAISPEYIQFWDKISVNAKPVKRKKIFSINEIDRLLCNVEHRKNTL